MTYFSKLEFLQKKKFFDPKYHSVNDECFHCVLQMLSKLNDSFGQFLPQMV